MPVLFAVEADDPAGVPAQSPAGDGAYERFLILERINKQRYQLWQVRFEAVDTALSDGTKGEDAALAYAPVRVEKFDLKVRQKNLKKFRSEAESHDIKCCSRALSEVPFASSVLLVIEILVKVVLVFIV